MHQNVFVLQIHRSFAAMQKVGVIRSIRSDIKAEEKRQRKEQRVLLQHIKFRLSICDHDFHIFLPYRFIKSATKRSSFH